MLYLSWCFDETNEQLPDSNLFRALEAHMTRTFLLALMLFFTAVAAVASPMGDMPYKPERPYPAMDSNSRFLSPDGVIDDALTIGTEYAELRRIANIPTANKSVTSDTGNAYAIVGLGRMQLGFTRVVNHLTIKEIGQRNDINHHGDIFMLKILPSRQMFPLPFNGNAMVGALYFQENGHQNEIYFTQPFVGMQFDMGGARVKAGWNWTDGDIETTSGWFAGVQAELMKDFVLFADYNEKDINKVVINKIILPKMGIDCTDCDDSSLTFGISFKMFDFMYANLAFYDVQDLSAPMGSVSMKFRY